MKKWVRLSTAATILATALAVGLSSASASASSSLAPPTPTAPDHSHSGAVPDRVLTPTRIESVYNAITPCRIVDTRLSGALLSNGTIRTYYVGGTFGFAPQGGKSGGCGIPVGATAIAATLTAITPSHAGFLRAWPNGLAEPNATVLNYSAGMNTGTGATLAINSSSALALKVKNYNGPTDLVIDVSGYYAPQIEGMVSPAAAIYTGSSRLVSAVRNGVGNFTVTIDSDVSYCTPTVTAYSGFVYASAYNFNGNKVQVFLWYLVGGVPTAYDGYFYLNVTC